MKLLFSFLDEPITGWANHASLWLTIIGLNLKVRTQLNLRTNSPTVKFMHLVKHPSKSVVYRC